MRYDAVIFDLYGTLVNNIRDADYHRFMRQLAGLFRVSDDQLVAAWLDDEFRVHRRTGLLSSYAAQVTHLCGLLGQPIIPERIHAGVRACEDFFAHCLDPRPDAVATLTAIRDAGLRLGLVSDCGHNVPDRWLRTPFHAFFDQPVFSCQVGMQKPDARMFALAIERIGAPAARCLYVGDGDGDEMRGAAHAGMTPLLICVPYERDIVMTRDYVRGWTGPVIERLRDTLDYLALPVARADA